MSSITLTERELHNMIKEAVHDVLSQQKQIKDWNRQDAQLYSEFELFLQRNGIKSAHIKQNNGSYAISISTDEFKKYAVSKIADRFAQNKNMYTDAQMYPAVTYLYLRRE